MTIKPSSGCQSPAAINLKTGTQQSDDRRHLLQEDSPYFLHYQTYMCGIMLFRVPICTHCSFTYQKAFIRSTAQEIERWTNSSGRYIMQSRSFTSFTHKEVENSPFPPSFVQCFYSFINCSLVLTRKCIRL